MPMSLDVQEPPESGAPAEDEALVFLLLERATPPGCTVSPHCVSAGKAF